MPGILPRIPGIDITGGGKSSVETDPVFTQWLLGNPLNGFLTQTDADNRYLLLTGGTLTGDLKFTDGLYDIGKSGATRPRDLFLSRHATIGGHLTLAQELNLTSAVNQIVLDSDGTYTGTMTMAALSGASKVWTFPNATGTIALTGDLSGYASLTADNALLGNQTIGATSAGKNLSIIKRVYPELSPVMAGGNGENWTFSNTAGYALPLDVTGTITKTGTSIGTCTPTSQTITIGKEYDVTVTVDSQLAGINFSIGGVDLGNKSTGTFSTRITATSTAKFLITPLGTGSSNNGFVISSISVVEHDETTGNLTLGQDITLGNKITFADGSTIDVDTEDSFKGQLVLTSSVVRIAGMLSLAGAVYTTGDFGVEMGDGNVVYFYPTVDFYSGANFYDYPVNFLGGSIVIGATTLTEQNVIDLLALLP